LLPAQHLRGIAFARLGDTRNAIGDLSRVWTGQPTNYQAALGLGSLLRQADRFEEALEPLRAASRQPEHEANARYELARCLTRLRRSNEAIEEYRLILQLSPEHTEAAANLSMLLERANRLDEARDWADHALAASPGNLVAGLTRATLDRRTGHTAEAITRLETLLKGDPAPLNKSIILNQLGQCHDQAAQWDAAYQRFKQSNDTLRTHHPHGQPLDFGSYGLNTIDQLRNWLKTQPPASWTDDELPDSINPVFLVGFPRSGTTLMDQALSAHPEIEVLEEHELFDTVRQQWVEGYGLQKLPHMNAAEIQAARENYMDERSVRCNPQGKSVVIDKLPLNLVYLFLVHRLFPGSPILFMLRDPRDACLSCYFQSFDLQGAMPYFLDFNDTTNYYDRVMSLATETMACIDNPLLTLRYENLVQDFETCMRSAVSFLGLEWHRDVLDYRRISQNRSISTPSYQQVVQPLYNRSIGRWKHYRQHMEPGINKLGQWVDHFGYPGE